MSVVGIEKVADCKGRNTLADVNEGAYNSDSEVLSA